MKEGSTTGTCRCGWEETEEEEAVVATGRGAILAGGMISV